MHLSFRLYAMNVNPASGSTTMNPTMDQSMGAVR